MPRRHVQSKQETTYARLKELRRQQKKVSEDLNLLLKEKERIDTQVSKATAEQKRIEKEIETIEEGMKTPELTDHARVQFFNRCLGFDMEKIDELILTQRTKQIVEQLGENTGKFPFTLDNPDQLRTSLVRPDFKPKTNYAIRMKKGFVVTVIED